MKQMKSTQIFEEGGSTHVIFTDFHSFCMDRAVLEQTQTQTKNCTFHI